MTDELLDSSGNGNDNGGTAVATSANYGDEVSVIGDQLVKLSAIDCRSLLDYLKETYGIEPPETPVLPDTGGVIVVDGKEEKTHFDIHLASLSENPNRIGIIKLIRETTGLGLAESKAAIDALPKLLKEIVLKADAETLKKKFEDLGAKIELK